LSSSDLVGCDVACHTSLCLHGCTALGGLGDPRAVHFARRSAPGRIAARGEGKGVL
jgi:hypothetical protein